MEGENDSKSKPWEATEDNIDPDKIEDVRKALLSSYHSYIQTHAGYIIALIIGFFALVSGFEPFLKTWQGTIVFVLLIVALPILVGYMVLRIVYWTSFSNYVTGLTIRRVRICFNKHNNNTKHAYYEKPPYFAILQVAAKQAFKDDEKILPWFKKWALKTAGKSEK